jgi:hypothetical protein
MLKYNIMKCIEIVAVMWKFLWRVARAHTVGPANPLMS